MSQYVVSSSIPTKRRLDQALTFIDLPMELIGRHNLATFSCVFSFQNVRRIRNTKSAVRIWSIKKTESEKERSNQ